MLILFASADMVEVFKALLCACRLKARLYAAVNLDECHYAFTQHNFDLIIVDRNMIGQGIFSPAEHVRKAGYDCPVLTYHETGIKNLATAWLGAHKKSLLLTEIALFAQTLETPEIRLFACNTHQPILLRPQVKTILALLLQNVQKPVAITTLAAALWGSEIPEKRNTLYAYVCELRAILLTCSGGTNMIRAQKGAYMLHFENIPEKIK